MVMAAAARVRLPHSSFSMRISSGQVATTYMLAQTIANKKGLTIQKVAIASTPIDNITNVVRAVSVNGEPFFITLSLPLMQVRLLLYWISLAVATLPVISFHSFAFPAKLINNVLLKSQQEL
jgi:hypothetical protein